MTQPSTKKWQKIKIFNTYDEANKLRNELKNEPGNENLEIKIRRCGPLGTQFKVKTYRPTTQNKK
tara:strand:+ start:2516 stop:2710 length:195 start_codon:yes stop_codon:yes gene_type:complete